MSRSERARTPPDPAQDAAVATAYGLSETQLSTDTDEVQDNVANPRFFDLHVKHCPTPLVESLRNSTDVIEQVRKIREVTTKESPIYAPVAGLLTLISKKIFDSFTTRAKDELRLPRADSPIIFLNHHRFEISHFPVGPRLQEAPDVVGVYGTFEEFAPLRMADNTYRAVPYHRVETVVEAKSKRKDGKEQAMGYLFRLQQSRPDRPGAYGVSVKPQHFQVIYSSPLGLEASVATPWSDPAILERLCSYVYSLYDPPAGHFLYDRTVTWVEPSGHLFGPASWTITAGECVYTGCILIFVGNPWGRRTTVFRVQRDGLPPVIIKEYYLDSGRRYEEGELLEQIHAEGFILGVPRLISSDEVCDGLPLTFRDVDKEMVKTKRRLVLADAGLDLEQARTVNDILMAVYDVLEVHRTIARHRLVLHRDASIYNILMYPTAVQCEGAPLFKMMPPLITDVLAGQLPEDSTKRVSCGLLIDFDHGAKLSRATDAAQDDAAQQVLRDQTGTPIYIARNVAARRVKVSMEFAAYHKMPKLSGNALSLYLKVYGEARYHDYNDDDTTYHGGKPPSASTNLALRALAKTVQFYHRWEYDAESVFWTLYSILVRVLPAGHVETRRSLAMFGADWGTLSSHTINREDALTASDPRQGLFAERDHEEFSEAFPPVMRHVASLLFDMAAHVFPAYAIMPTLPRFDDHLHEAMQRLILQYLVDHQDNPIPLTPGVLRQLPPKDKGDAINRQFGMFGTSIQTSTKSQSSKRALEDTAEGEPQAKKTKRPQKIVTPPIVPEHLKPRADDPPALKGEWKWRSPSSA